MNHRKTLLAASIVAGLCLSVGAYAQDNNQNTQNTSAPNKKDAKQLNTVVVTGIRDSQAMSLDLKKDSAAHVEIVTAEDIGKLPAKNVADTIAQLPGVNISDAGGTEGGFDEADRVSLRGTAPGLTLTTVDGHSLSSGDWFVLGNSNSRSVSYSALPSEVVSEVKVYKSSEAHLQEGGAAGTVDIITRKPLEFGKQITAEASVGGVYSDLPSNTKPQFNGLFNWKNDDNTFGAMFQAFYEQRSLQRDGQEMLGYSYLPSTSALAGAYPNLAGKYFPNLPGAALFEQTRKRKGGNITLQWKPTDNLSFDLDTFYSKLNATDVNYNYMLFNYSHLPTVTNLSSYTVQNNVITSAAFPGMGASTPGVYDQISRPGESESSGYITLNTHWKATQNLDFKFQGGITRGTGDTPTQNVMELNTGVGAGASYSLQGLGTPANWMLGSTNNANTNNTFSWIFGANNVHVTDKEQWFQADGEYDFDDAGALSSIMFGARYANHDRDDLTAIGQSPGCSNGAALNWGLSPYYCAPGSTSAYDPAVYSMPAGGNYPGSFASDLGVGQMPSNIWLWTPAQLAALSKYAYRDPVVRNEWGLIYGLNEHNTAAYVQFNFDSQNWSGNFGFRWISTHQNIAYTSPNIVETDYVGPIGGSAWGPFYWNYHHSGYRKLLPSFNMKFKLTDDGNLLARFAASQTLTRQDYSQLASGVSLSDPQQVGVIGGGSGGNPNLQPTVSTNFDAALEWYFAPRGLLAASVYEMDLHNYYDYGTTTQTYYNTYLSNPKNNPANPTGAPVYSQYLVSIPVNVNATVKGVELNYIQPIGDHFGTSLNYTYANGHENGGTLLYNPDGSVGNSLAAGSRPMIGNSRNTLNASAFYEDAKWNARISYTYRSAFYDGLQAVATGNIPLIPYWQAGTGYLSASLGYKINDHVSLAFDAMNLNNPKLRYYDVGSQAGLGFGKVPEAFYTNGRQYYLTANFKF